MTNDNENVRAQQLKNEINEILVFADLDRSLLSTSGRASDSVDLVKPRIAVHKSLTSLAERLAVENLDALTAIDIERSLSATRSFLAAADDARNRPGAPEVQRMFHEMVTLEQTFREIQIALTKTSKIKPEQLATAELSRVTKEGKKNLSDLARSTEELITSLELKRADIELRLSALERISTDASNLIQNLTETSANYTPLYENSKSLIEDLRHIKDQAKETLSSASQVGLASSFGARKRSLARAALAWIAGFIAGLTLILAATLVPAESTLSLSFKIFEVGMQFDKSPAALLLAKLSVLTPCIWLAWFAARQYAKTQRLMEDYAYKEATAHAYVGYRDQMEGDPELIRMLREAAIKTFSENPNSAEVKIEAVSPLNELLEKCIDKISGDRISDIVVKLIDRKK